MISFPQSSLISFPFTPMTGNQSNPGSVVSVRSMDGELLLRLPDAQMLSMKDDLSVTLLSVRDGNMLDDTHQPLLACLFKIQDMDAAGFDGNRALFNGWLLDEARAYIGEGGVPVAGDPTLLLPPVQRFAVRCPVRVQVELLFLPDVLPESKYADVSGMSSDEIALTVKIRNFMNVELQNTPEAELNTVLNAFWKGLSMEEKLYLDAIMSVDYLADSTDKRQLMFMSWLDDMLDADK